MWTEELRKKRGTVWGQFPLSRRLMGTCKGDTLHSDAQGLTLEMQWLAAEPGRGRAVAMVMDRLSRG